MGIGECYQDTMDPSTILNIYQDFITLAPSVLPACLPPTHPPVLKYLKQSQTSGNITPEYVVCISKNSD